MAESFRSYAWLYSRLYRVVQTVLHRFNLHYMPPAYPDGDTVLWCRWCGARTMIRSWRPMSPRGRVVAVPGDDEPIPDADFFGPSFEHKGK